MLILGTPCGLDARGAAVVAEFLYKVRYPMALYQMALIIIATWDRLYAIGIHTHFNFEHLYFSTGTYSYKFDAGHNAFLLWGILGDLKGEKAIKYWKKKHKRIFKPKQ